MRRVCVICVVCFCMTGAVTWASTAAASSPATSLLGVQSVATTHDGGSGASEAFGYTAGATGTATSAHVYLDTTDGVRIGVYADKSGKPGVKLGYGGISANSAGWVTVSLSGGAHIVKGTRYWIAIAANVGGGTVGYRDAGSSGSTLDYSGTGLANPYSATHQWNSNPASVYIGGTSSTPAVAPTNTAAPTITGTAKQGSVLSDSPGTWAGTAPIGYTYQWQRNGATNIAGATSSTYTLSAGDVGDTIDVRVTAANAGGSASASSAPSARVVGSTPAAPVNTALELVSGTATQGQHLTTTNGTWSGNPTAYAYQWRDCDTAGNNCTSVTGANSSSYLLAASDVGHMMRIVLTATNSTGSTSATSLATGVVGAATGAAPTSLSVGTLSGTDTQGQTLTTTNGTWSGSPTGYTYQWQDCNASGAACASITGATSVSYLLGSGDVGHTMRAAVTAANASGSATAASGASTVVSGTAGGLPAGVTLKPIDGGPNYYCSHGFTNACNDGWDSPSFFPVGPWYGRVTSTSDVTRWKDLGWNTAFRTDSATNLPLMQQNGLDAIVDDEGGNPETPGMGSETVGLLSSDEPASLSAGVTGPLSGTPNSQQDGRFWYLNNTWNFIYYGGLTGDTSSSDVLSKLVTTPNGTSRHIDTQSVDTYWFSGAKNVPAWGELYEGGLLYNLGVNGNTGSSNMTVTEAECGCRYGDAVDMIRAFQTKYPAPIAQIVEDGGPYSQDTSGSDYITPPEMNWASWSSIVHGARQLVYFDHTFAGPGDSDDTFSDPYYQTVQPGQTTSIYAQAKATDSLIAHEAPEINSPQMIGYVTATPSYQTFSGIETRATDDNGTYTIFADTRDAESASNSNATFTLAGGYSGPVTVVGESRTLTATNGVFTDTFAKGSTVHIYQIG
jgi:hypothetical protein